MRPGSPQEKSAAVNPMSITTTLKHMRHRWWTAPVRETILVCLLLFILISLLFWRMVWWQWILFDGDMWTQYYPAKWYSFTLIKQGKFPFWTPNLLFGFPLFAEAQTGILYPLSALFLLLPTVNAFNVSIIIRLLLAGLFTFLYVRRITRQNWAAAISGVAFACGGYMVAQLRHENVENALIWLPLILLALDRWITEDNRRALAGAGICMGVSFLAGYFYISLFVLITATAYYILMGYFAYRDDRSKGKKLKQWGGGLVLFGLIGVGLAGAQLAPNYELARESIRAGGLGYQVSTQVSMSPFQLICFIFPKFFGYPSDGTIWGLWRGNPIDLIAYFGIVPLFLAIGAVMIRRDRYTLFFGAVCGIALLLALGQFSPVWYLVNKLPIFSMMRNPARFLSLVAFSGAVLAGLGFAALIQASGFDRRRILRYQSAVGIGAGIILFGSLISGWAISTSRPLLSSFGRWFVDKFVYAQSVHEHSREYYYTLIDRFYDQLANTVEITHPYIYVPVLYVIGGSLLIWYITHQRRNPLVIGLIALILTGSDLILFGRHYNTIMPPEVYEQESYYIKVMEQDPGIFRYCFAPLEISMRNYDALLFDQMYSQGHSPLRMKRQQDIIETLRPQLENLSAVPAVPLMNLLNIKYIVTDDSLSQDWARIRFNEGARVYENRDVLPRAFVTPRAQILPSGEQVLAALADPAFSPRDVVLLEEAPQMPTPLTQGSSSGEAEILRYDIDEVVINVESDGGYLVLTDTFYPGWWAEIDGVEQPILRADYFFRAVYVSPGQHRVRFVYTPFSFMLGAVISILAFGAALGVFFSQRKVTT